VKTYVTDELPLNLQNFICDYSRIYRRLSVWGESKSDLNSYLQQEYGIRDLNENEALIKV
jgi:hypothetical protein